MLNLKNNNLAYIIEFLRFFCLFLAFLTIFSCKTRRSTLDLYDRVGFDKGTSPYNGRFVATNPNLYGKRHDANMVNQVSGAPTTSPVVAAPSIARAQPIMAPQPRVAPSLVADPIASGQMPAAVPSGPLPASSNPSFGANPDYYYYQNYQSSGAGSRFYNNPYSFQGPKEYPYYESDRYYVAPVNNNNVSETDYPAASKKKP